MVISLVVLGLVAVVGAGCTQSAEKIQLLTVADRQLVELAVDDELLVVEVVNSSESVKLGLSGREEIGSDGMLFALPDRSVARFWMKEMRFALDMVWIDGETVVGVTENAPTPEPGIAERVLPTYSSPSEVTAVLELPAGKAAEYGISAGSNITPMRLIDAR